jgi:hypothetical protein
VGVLLGGIYGGIAYCTDYRLVGLGRDGVYVSRLNTYRIHVHVDLSGISSVREFLNATEGLLYCSVGARMPSSRFF